MSEPPRRRPVDQSIDPLAIGATNDESKNIAHARGRRPDREPARRRAAPTAGPWATPQAPAALRAAVGRPDVRGAPRRPWDVAVVIDDQFRPTPS